MEEFRAELAALKAEQQKDKEEIAKLKQRNEELQTSNAPASRSAALTHTAKVETPRFEFDKGMSYDEYAKCVNTWDKLDLAGTSVSRAGLLLMEFSSNDIYGGLKERLLDAVTVPVLKSEKGVCF